MSEDEFEYYQCINANGAESRLTKGEVYKVAAKDVTANWIYLTEQQKRERQGWFRHRFKRVEDPNKTTQEILDMLKRGPDNVSTETKSVNHPDHYNQGEIECIDAVASMLGPELFGAFLQGNVHKYLWRCRYKGKMTEDLRKALWYLERLIEHTISTGEDSQTQDDRLKDYPEGVNL